MTEPAYVPTLEQIKDACRLIQENWTPAQRLRRQVGYKDVSISVLYKAGIRQVGSGFSTMAYADCEMTDIEREQHDSDTVGPGRRRRKRRGR